MHFETISPNPLLSAGRSPTLRTPLVLRWAACRALTTGVDRFRAPWAFWQKPCFGREGPCRIRPMPHHLPRRYPINPVITSEDFSLCISGHNLGGKSMRTAARAPVQQGSSLSVARQTQARFGYTQTPNFHITPPYRNWLAWDSLSLQGVISQASPPPGRAGHGPSPQPMPEFQHRAHRGRGRCCCCWGTLLLAFCILDVSIRGWCQGRCWALSGCGGSAEPGSHAGGAGAGAGAASAPQANPRCNQPR